MKNLLMMTGAAAFAAGVICASAANAATVTYNDNGIVWTFVTNGDTTGDGSTAVTLGPDTKENPSSDSERAIPAATSVDAASIPWAFTDNNVSYTVTKVGMGAFYNCKLSGTLTIPSTVKAIGNRGFQGCTALTKLASLGGATTLGNYAFAENNNMAGDISVLSGVSSLGIGAFQGCVKLTGDVVFDPSLTTIPSRLFNRASGIESVTVPDTVAYIDNKAFEGTTFTGFLVPGSARISCNVLFKQSKLKVFFAGPDTVAKDTNTSATGWGAPLSGVTGCKAFVPSTSSWGTYNAINGGTGTQTIYYGPDKDIDFEIDMAAKKIIAKPKTAAMIANAIAWASDFRDHLGYSEEIVVSDFIEMSEGTITAAALAGVDFKTMLMMFKVKTQAQLDAVLAAVPQTAMLAIDPTDATEALTLPQDRALWVWLSGTGKYVPKINGLIITFR